MSASEAVRGGQALRLLVPCLILLLTLGLLLPLHGIRGQSLWLDELWTAAATDPALSWRDWMQEWVLPDVHPPLHLFLLRLWRGLFGSEPMALRLLSYAVTLGGVAGLLLLHRFLPILRQPLLLVAWLACTAGMVLYAQEARPYALLLTTTAMATWLAAGVGERMERGEAIAAPLAALVAVTVAATYSHFFGALIAAGLFGALFLFAAIWHVRHVWAIALSGILALGAFVPWLLLHVPHIEKKLGGKFWVTNRWAGDFINLAGLATGSAYLTLGLIVAVGAMLVHRPRLLRLPACWIPLGAILLTLLGAMAISLHTPVITDRNLLVLVPPFLLLVVAVVTCWTAGEGGWLKGRGAEVLLIVIAASLLLSGYRVATLQKDQWREAAQEVAALEGCEAASLQVYFWPKEVYAYYLPPSYRERLRRVSLTDADPDELSRIRPLAGDCPLILWSGHLLGPWVVDWILENLDLKREDVLIRHTQGNMIVLDRQRLEAE